MLRTPIKAPWNVVSMVCLESAILEAPSMFAHSLREDASNQMAKFITISPQSGVTNIYQNYWGETNPTGGARATDQSNTRCMKDVLRSVVDLNLTNIEQVASFLAYFIYSTKAFRCYLGGYYK